MKPTRKTAKAVDVGLTCAQYKSELEHYEKLIGLEPALELMRKRSKARMSLHKTKIKSPTEQQASSRPDGRLNGYNMALGSLVSSMGGKRKAKKTKRGY